ncbi:MAG: hypothetical protein CL661_08620 [Bacteroidetes bacterium]|jgi:hypothetical protein|nr:hypothetical protein [Bacteroidota bacterium]|tara:strand:+ start:447 stop:773 length:327 start_codon:yes stop_codon:yes gene_type:complete
MKTLLNRRFIITLGILIICTSTSAQIGINSDTPEDCSALDITADSAGLLLPRIALNSLTDSASITGNMVNGLMVYNTNTTTDLTPGIYMWYETNWLNVSLHPNLDRLV